MPKHRTDRDFVRGDTEPQPRLRVNRSEKLPLTTTWQRLDFNGTSALNGNTFPMVDGAKPKVMWEPSTRLFRFMSDVDRNYDIQLGTKVTNSSLLAIALLSLTHLQMRFVVPAPTPIYFPLPDTDGFVNLYEVNAANANNGSFGIPVYANASIRQHGLGIDLRLSSGTLAVDLAGADCVVYGR